MLRRENVFWADDDPVYRVTTYVPWTIAEGTGLLEPEIPHPYGIHGVLEDQGYPMARLHDVATARMPTLAEKDALRLPAGVPVIDLLHVSVRADGEALRGHPLRHARRHVLPDLRRARRMSTGGAP